MDVRQFSKNRGAVSKKSKNEPNSKGNPNVKGIKTFSGGFSKTNENFGHVRKNSDFGIWIDKTSDQVGKEKGVLDRKQEHKRRIAIEAIKLAEQRNQAILKRKIGNENDVPVQVPTQVKPQVKNAARRALFCLDVNQPGKIKSNYLSNVALKLPSIKEIEPYLDMENKKGRPILKTSAFSNRHSDTKSLLFEPPTDLMKGLKLEEPKDKKTQVYRYTAKELMAMNPKKSNSKFNKN